MEGKKSIKNFIQLTRREDNMFENTGVVESLILKYSLIMK